MRSTIFLYVIAVILPIWITVMLVMPAHEKPVLPTNHPYMVQVEDEAAKRRADADRMVKEQSQAREIRDAKEQLLQAKYRQEEQQRR